MGGLHGNGTNVVEIIGDVFLHARKMRRLAENIYEITDVDFYLKLMPKTSGLITMKVPGVWHTKRLCGLKGQGILRPRSDLS